MLTIEQEQTYFKDIETYIKETKQRAESDEKFKLELEELKKMTFSEWLAEIGADPERVEEEQKKEEVQKIIKFNKAEYAKIWRNKNKSYMKDYNNNNKEQKRKLYLKSKGKIEE